MKLTYLIGLIFLFLSCNTLKISNEQSKDKANYFEKINQLDWLIGKWENISGKRSLV